MSKTWLEVCQDLLQFTFHSSLSISSFLKHNMMLYEWKKVNAQDLDLSQVQKNKKKQTKKKTKQKKTHTELC